MDQLSRPISQRAPQVSRMVLGLQSEEIHLEWFKELYDDFRMRTGFGNIPALITTKEVDFLVQELSLSKGSRVLDLFCGTGRHSIELVRRGIVAVGIEFNADYLRLAAARAQAAGVAPTFVQGDVRDTDFGDGYDAIIIMYHSFGYFEDAEDRRILQKVYKALRPGGYLFLEILSRDFLIRNFQAKDERTVEGIVVREEREFDMVASRINSTITRSEPGGSIVRRVSWRVYAAHEIKAILEGLGFQFVSGYADLEKNPLTLETRLMRLIFERTKY
jgi:SAM-dependent methyltransferase